MYARLNQQIAKHPRQAAEQFHAARETDATYSQAFEAESRALEAAGDPAGAAQVRSLAQYQPLGSK